MGNNLLIKAKKYYQREGFYKTLKRTIKFLEVKLLSIFFKKEGILSNYILYKNEHIISKSIEAYKVQNKRTKQISYDGLFFDNLPYQIKRHVGKKNIPERKIYEFSQAKVIGPEMAFCINDKYIPPQNVDSELEHTLKLYKRYGLKRLLTDYKKCDSESELGFLMAGTIRGSGFPKMYIEVFPKLIWYEKYCKMNNENPTLLFPQLKNYQKRLLNYLGYSDEDYTELDNDIIKFKRLLVPSYPVRTLYGNMNFSPSNLLWVRNNIFEKIPEKDEEYPSKIYIARRNVSKRFVKNEKQVIETLKNLGFSWFGDPGYLEFEEQIRLFANADIIVGGHGSNLGNIIFSSDATLIELFSGEEGATGHFFVTSNAVNIDYDFIVCKPKANKCNQDRHYDMIVDTNVLEEVVSYYL